LPLEGGGREGRGRGRGRGKREREGEGEKREGDDEKGEKGGEKREGECEKGRKVPIQDRLPPRLATTPVSTKQIVLSTS
jgi:hypothetical protein